LILRKIIKIVATRCQILTLKCTKIDFGWGSAPDVAGGAYSAPTDSLAGFKGPTSSTSTFIDICKNRIEIKSKNEKMIYAKRLSE